MGFIFICSLFLFIPVLLSSNPIISYFENICNYDTENSSIKCTLPQTNIDEFLAIRKNYNGSFNNFQININEKYIYSSNLVKMPQSNLSYIYCTIAFLSTSNPVQFCSLEQFSPLNNSSLYFKIYAAYVRTSNVTISVHNFVNDIKNYNFASKVFDFVNIYKYKNIIRIDFSDLIIPDKYVGIEFIKSKNYYPYITEDNIMYPIKRQACTYSESTESTLCFIPNIVSFYILNNIPTNVFSYVKILEYSYVGTHIFIGIIFCIQALYLIYPSKRHSILETNLPAFLIVFFSSLFSTAIVLNISSYYSLSLIFKLYSTNFLNLSWFFLVSSYFFLNLDLAIRCYSYSQHHTVSNPGRNSNIAVLSLLMFFISSCFALFLSSFKFENLPYVKYYFMEHKFISNMIIPCFSCILLLYSISLCTLCCLIIKLFLSKSVDYKFSTCEIIGPNMNAYFYSSLSSMFCVVLSFCTVLFYIMSSESMYLLESTCFLSLSFLSTICGFIINYFGLNSSFFKIFKSLDSSEMPELSIYPEIYKSDPPPSSSPLTKDFEILPVQTANIDNLFNDFKQYEPPIHQENVMKNHTLFHGVACNCESFVDLVPVFKLSPIPITSKTQYVHPIYENQTTRQNDTDIEAQTQVPWKSSGISLLTHSLTSSSTSSPIYYELDSSASKSNLSVDSSYLPSNINGYKFELRKPLLEIDFNKKQQSSVFKSKLNDNIYLTPRKSEERPRKSYRRTPYRTKNKFNCGEKTSRGVKDVASDDVTHSSLYL